VGSYYFDGNLDNSSGPGFGMIAVDSNSPYSPSDYSIESVFGTSKKVLNLTARQGLNVDVSAIGDHSSYTLVMDVRSEEIYSYNKLMSLDGGDSDSGVYFKSYAVNFYPLGSGSATLTANEWVRVALSYDRTNMNLYYGDPNAFTLAVSGSANAYYTLSDTLQFLTDDAHTSYAENYPLQVSALWIFDTPMALEDVGDLPASVPEPASYAAILGLLACAGMAVRKRTISRARQGLCGPCQGEQ